MGERKKVVPVQFAVVRLPASSGQSRRESSTGAWRRGGGLGTHVALSCGHLIYSHPKPMGGSDAHFTD